MLIKTESNQIQIAAEELVRKTRHQFEQEARAALERNAATIAPDKAGMDVTKAEQRMGRPMSGWTLEQKLTKIAPFLYFERSNADPTKTGIYIALHRLDPKLYKGHLQFVCGMETGVMPEFSVIEAEAHPVPDVDSPGGTRLEFGMAREVRGWRTVLARLLAQHVITAGDVEKHFQISLGRDSSRWQELLAGRIELMSEEVINGGNEGTVGQDNRGDPAPDGERGPLGGDQPEHGSADRADSGNEEARRRDAGEAGRGEAAPEGSAGVGDPAGEDRGAGPDQRPE